MENENTVLENINENGEDSLKDKTKILQIEGTKYKTYFTKKFENRIKWEKPDERKIISYLPGTILKLMAKKGQKLEAGDPILILEAMKMQNIILIPVGGKVKNIFVKEGDKIPKGHLMMELA